MYITNSIDGWAIWHSGVFILVRLEQNAMDYTCLLRLVRSISLCCRGQRPSCVHVLLTVHLCSAVISNEALDPWSHVDLQGRMITVVTTLEVNNCGRILQLVKKCRVWCGRAPSGKPLGPCDSGERLVFA